MDLEQGIGRTMVEEDLKCLRLLTDFLFVVNVPFFLRDYTRESLPADSPKAQCSISTAMDMLLLKPGFTFFAVFWMPCGKSPLFGSWAPCPTIPRNSLILLGCVSGMVALLFMRLT